jgi:hypothetical protein
LDGRLVRPQSWSGPCGEEKILTLPLNQTPAVQPIPFAISAEGILLISSYFLDNVTSEVINKDFEGEKFVGRK